MATMETDPSAAMPRLLSKLHTGSESILEQYSLDKLPGTLPIIGQILNQFDQTMFNILMFSTNFSLLTRLYQSDKGQRAADFVMFYPLNNVNDDIPLAVDNTSYEVLRTAFGDATDLSFEEFEQIMLFEGNRNQLQLLCQAFAAVWLRDYGETVEVTPSLLVNHLKNIFHYEHLSQGDRLQIDESDFKISARFVKHVLVTFTHMASKDYERITRSA
uniref:Uncharacterized protein n=1 Tax=Spongospora subterranea TaxID=70186 RepID=A0A0H5RD64_9EUKA|eukprot:CRZ06469.1 hypothetical protein [Spongospora subterranea]